ncbi:hypothetical protein U1Q18_007936 [Sarracenia purpurea var. burkii]
MLCRRLMMITTTSTRRRWVNPTEIVMLMISASSRSLLFRKSFSSSSSRRRKGQEEEVVPRESVDCVVIGAGVVGIAVARELSLKRRRHVLVIDSASTFGTGTSSRNSEVIHSGIYYPPNSLKVSLSRSF